MDPTSAPPRILLVDCDAFFVQVARLEDPEGAGREPLLIVGGSPSGRGVVTSASYECRAYGVRSAMPTAHALRLCPDAMVVGVPRGAIAERSRAVRDTLEALAPVVEAASVDEFYLDLSGTERLFHDEPLSATARRIQTEVFRSTSVRVSVGGGTNRLIAKLAVAKAKPAGVHVVQPGAETEFVGTLALGDLPGVGPALVATLEKKGLTTVEQALAVDVEWLERWLGEGRGRWLRARMLGRDDTPVTGREARRSISSERTFAADLHDDDRLERELLRLVVSVAGTLRSRALRARTVTVKIRDEDFTTRQRAWTFPEAVEADAPVFAVARRLLAELRERRRTGARLLGVALSNLVDRDSPDQLGLFERAGRSETERDRRLARTVDRVRERFGEGALLPGRIVRPARPALDDDATEGG